MDEAVSALNLEQLRASCKSMKDNGYVLRLKYCLVLLY